MLKKLLITTAVSGLMISSAFAQSTMSPSSPSATSPSSSSSAADSSASKGSASSASIISSQKPDQWLASKFKGTDVLGPDNAKVGDVTDILFTKDGKIDAYLVSVGGFLGVGTKDVALAPSQFQVVPGDNNSADKLKISMTKDQLKEAQNFQTYNSSRTTTGASSGGSSSGMAGSTGSNAGGSAGSSGSTRSNSSAQ